MKLHQMERIYTPKQNYRYSPGSNGRLQGRTQADARASSKFGPQFCYFLLLNFEFSRFFSFTPTSEFISL